MGGYILSPSTAYAQTKTSYELKPIHWLSWEQAIIAQNLSPRKLFIFIYDDSNPHSVKMDSSFMSDTVINVYLNEYYHCVRLSFDSDDTIHYRGYKLVQEFDTTTQKYYHQLALALNEESKKFPSVIILDTKQRNLTRARGYSPYATLGRALSYYAHDEYLQQKVMKFGQAYQCLNPNHPHYMLQKMSRDQEKLNRSRNE